MRFGNRCDALVSGVLPVLILFVLGIGGACWGDPVSDANDLERAKELVAKYEGLERKLAATIEAAELADPNLGRFKAAREKMKRWYDHGLGPARRQWLQWKKDQGDPKEADAIFDRVGNLGGVVSFAKDLEDPNLGPFIRYTMLPILIKGAQDPNTIVGPYTTADEKDKDKQWRGFKKFTGERAALCKPRLEQYVQEKNVPKWLVQLAVDKGRGETYLMFYKIAIGERTPREVYDIKKEISRVCIELSRILPPWNSLRGRPEEEWKKALEQNRRK